MWRVADGPNRAARSPSLRASTCCPSAQQGHACRITNFVWTFDSLMIWYAIGASLPYIVAYRDHKKGTCNGNGVLFETDTLKVYGDGPHTHPKHDFRIAPHFRYFLGGLIFPFWRCMGKCMGNRLNESQFLP